MSPQTSLKIQRKPKSMIKKTRLYETVFTTKDPNWKEFRGGTYDGRATHDVLGQNAVMNMLSKGRQTKIIPKEARLLIGKYTAQQGKMKNKETKIYRAVCRPDEDGERLMKAVVMSNAMRRLYNAIPSNYPLWKKYHNWTYSIANMEDIVQPGKIAMMCSSDPTHKSLTHTNRLHVRGLTKKLLGREMVTPESRPAYLPSATQFMQWCEETASENTKDRMLLHAEQIKKTTETTIDMLEHYIFLDRYKGIFNVGDLGPCELQQKNLASIIKLQQRMQVAQYEDKMMKWGMHIYAKTANLNLSTAEKDWFYMINAKQHDKHSSFM